MANDRQKAINEKYYRARYESNFLWGSMMVILTLFQTMSWYNLIFGGDEVNTTFLYVFLGFLAVEWGYVIVARIVGKRKSFELEIIGFFLSGISLVLSASVYEDFAFKQFVAVLLGLSVYIALLLVLRNVDIATKLRTPIAVAAVGLLIVNLLMAKITNGALNWIEIGGISIQPSEIVKIAFVYVGSATLVKLQSTRSITRYIIFAIACVGALFLMRDFGTALIFFFTFILIAYMRSGDIRTLIMICVAAFLGALLIIYFKPYVATRFSTYRHVWEDINGSGMQQTRTLIYSASGGLFGLGIGNGRLKGVFASTTDLVFGIVCEEWGLLMGFAIILTFAFIVFYAIRTARTTRSTFYAIAACAAAGMLLFQLSLNVFGVTDILPLTGVTLPFVSRGGSSMICSWAMLAFIKSADIRTYPKLAKTVNSDAPTLKPQPIRISRRRAVPPAPDVPVSKHGKAQNIPSQSADIPMNRRRSRDE